MNNKRALLSSLTETDRAEWMQLVYYWPERDITIATNGMMMVALAGDVYSEEPITDKVRKKIEHALATPTTPLGDRPIAAIKSWCGEEQPKKMTPCRCVNGRCVCELCEDDHACGICDGTAAIEDEPDPRYGRIFGVLLDLNKLARLLSPFEGNVSLERTATHDSRVDILRVSGEDWWGIICGMTESKDMLSKTIVFEEPATQTSERQP